MAQAIPIGTIVYLKSGSPAMTVTTGAFTEQEAVAVEWFAGSELRRDAFHKDSLTTDKPNHVHYYG